LYCCTTEACHIGSVLVSFAVGILCKSITKDSTTFFSFKHGVVQFKVCRPRHNILP
jgi:hypothetical protein